MLADRLRATEVESKKRAISGLRTVPWAGPLLDRFREKGGECPHNRDLMFEIRFAFELHRAGVTAQYEYRSGVGTSTVDFRVPGDPDWLIELVSIRPSEAMKRATHEHGLV